MADTKIEDLPTLDPQDFNPLTDFMIIQKPGGGTFKMLAGAGGTGGGSTVRSSYVDSATAGGAYTGGFHYNHTYTQSYGSFQFEEEGLLNTSSTFVMNVSLSNMTKGSSVSNTYNPYNRYKSIQTGPDVLKSKSFRFVKTANLDLVNNSFSTDSTQKFTFFDHSYAVRPIIHGFKNKTFKGWQKNSAKLECTLVFDSANDTISFNDITLTHYDISTGTDTRWAWPLNIDISADINGSIGV